MSFDFDIGSFRGQPNYLMRSKKGLCWDNLPPSLLSLVKTAGMEKALVDYALGPNGLYWFQYVGENGENITKTSPGLWKYLNCDPNDPPVVGRLEFGQARTFWGTYNWVEEDQQAYQGIFYDNLPVGLVNQITELDTSGQLCDYSEIGCLAMGQGNSWLLESKGWIWSERIDAGLLEALQAVDEGVMVKNVRLSPVQTDCWWVEYSDGSTHFQVPAHWTNAVTMYGSPQYAMSKPMSAASVGRSIGLGMKRVAPVAMAATVVGCILM